MARHTATESNPFIAKEAPHFQTYLEEHDYAVQWAVANRDLVAHRIKQCVFRPPDNDHCPTEEHIRNLGKIVDVTHNSVTEHSMFLAGENRDVWVHRKGAAPANKGVAPCPGSRGDFSWLLQPLGDGDYNGMSLNVFCTVADLFVQLIRSLMVPAVDMAGMHCIIQDLNFQKRAW